MPNEPSVKEIVAAFEKGFVNGGWRDLCDLPAMRALIADWRKRGEARALLEAELDVLSASHKDLAHRVARMGEALRQIETWSEHTRDDLADTVQRMQTIARSALPQSAESGSEK